MKRLLSIFIAAILIVSADAQFRSQHGHEHGRDRSRRIECATGEQMQIKKMDVACLCVTLGHFCVDDLAQLASMFSFDDNHLTRDIKICIV